MKIQIWSDVLCPYCFIGKRNFEAAVEKFEHREQVEVEWKSFELDPKAPKNTQPTMVKNLAQKYRKTLEDAQAMVDHVVLTAKRAGVQMDLAKAIPTNSFDAHRVIHLAKKHGRQAAAEERLFTAFMVKGEDISNHGTLIRIAGELGLPEDEMNMVINTSDFSDDVRKDENEAYHLKIKGVPYFLVAGKYAVSGAQSVEHFAEVLRQAWVSTANKKR